MSPARFRWGVLFILVGGLLLLNNMDVLEWWVWADILSLWPLILIAIGVEKIFTRTRAEVFAYLAPVALAAVVVWVAFDGFTVGDYRLTKRGSDYRYIIDMDSDAERIQAAFDLDDTDIDLKSTGTRLFQARSRGWKSVPGVDYELDDGVAELDVSPRIGRLPGWIKIDNWRRSGDWDVRLSDKLPIRISCYGDRADMTLDCRNLQVEDLLVDSRRGDVRIMIGLLVDDVKVRLEGENADFRLTVPEAGGVRVSGADDRLTNFFERNGLGETDGVFQTEGYDTLSPQIELDLSREITRFSLDFQ